MDDKKEKILLIVGGSSDMGMELARREISNFNRVIIHYNHMNETLEKLCKAENVICVKADLSDLEETKHLIEEVKTIGEPTHIVHFPAPRAQASRFHKISWDFVENEINISVRSAWMILAEFLPVMSKKKYGRVVVMLSYLVGGGIPLKYNADYVMIKNAMLGLVKALAVEYCRGGGEGVTVNGVSPGLVETKYVSELHELVISEHAKQSPTGLNLKVSDVVPVISFLLSDEAGSINGENIFIRCGR